MYLYVIKVYKFKDKEHILMSFICIIYILHTFHSYVSPVKSILLSTPLYR